MIRDFNYHSGRMLLKVSYPTTHNIPARIHANAPGSESVEVLT